MDRAIAAEEEDYIGVALSGHTDTPDDVRLALKWLEIFRRTSQPENGCRPHRADESSRNCGSERVMWGQPPSALLPALLGDFHFFHATAHPKHKLFSEWNHRQSVFDCIDPLTVKTCQADSALLDLCARFCV